MEHWETVHKEVVDGFDIELAMAPEEDNVGSVRIWNVSDTEGCRMTRPDFYDREECLNYYYDLMPNTSAALIMVIASAVWHEIVKEEGEK